MPRGKSTKKKKKQQQQEEDGGQGLYAQACKETRPNVKATLLRQAMKAGHLDSHAEYGMMICTGQLGRSQPEEAMRIWRLAGERGCGRSNYHMGMVAQQSGHHEVAVKLLTKAVDAGYPQAHVDLGILYWNGDGVTKDLAKAAEIFRRGMPHASSVYHLALCYQQGAGVEKDLVETVRLYKIAADQGDGYALTNLGRMYSHAEGGLERDDEQAVKLWKLAAAKGVSQAQAALGRCYQFGHGGLDRDLDEAVRLYRLGAEAGDSLAQYQLARLLEKGNGNLQRDVTEAVRLYHLAADQGESEARIALGRMHEQGEYPEPGRNYTAARNLYHLAINNADDGMRCAQAMVWLGSLIERGLGGHQDFHEAAKLYRRAIIFGTPGATADAAFHLGRLYEQGLGVETRDVEEALRYYVMADDYGMSPAEDAIQSLIDRGLISSDGERQLVRKIQFCANCGLQTEEKLQKCARCRRVRYCSLKCQKEAWPSHRSTCHRRSTRPSSQDDDDVPM